MTDELPFEPSKRHQIRLMSSRILAYRLDKSRLATNPQIRTFPEYT
jgi:hypothetical protein